MAQETERCGEPMPDHVPLPIATALPQAQHTASGLSGYHQLSPLPAPAGKSRALPRWVIDTGKSRTRTAPTAAFDLDVLSLSELKKMQNDVAKAIATFEDRHKVEARANVEASARDLGYSLAYGDPEQRTDSSGRRHGECTPERDPCSTSNNTSTASRSA